MKQTLLILMAVALVGCGKKASEVEPKTEAKQSPEEDRLQGVWVVIRLTDNGREDPLSDIKLKLTIKDNKYIYEVRSFSDSASLASFSATYKINPTTKPKEIDVTFEEGPQKGKTMLAIYSLKEEVLIICGGTEKRPTEFISNPKSRDILFVFKREKP